MKRISFLALAGLLSLGVGCQSISDSVTSPSRWLADSSTALGDSSDASAESSNAASKSSSGSSSPSDEPAAAPAESGYRQDVRVAARTWGNSTGTATEFSRELSRIASVHGVADWQSLPATWGGVTDGLRDAGVPQSEIDREVQALRGGSTSASTP